MMERKRVFWPRNRALFMFNGSLAVISSSHRLLLSDEVPVGAIDGDERITVRPSSALSCDILPNSSLLAGCYWQAGRLSSVIRGTGCPYLVTARKFRRYPDYSQKNPAWQIFEAKTFPEAGDLGYYLTYMQFSQVVDASRLCKVRTK
jgi:hypothetical protein